LRIEQLLREYKEARALEGYAERFVRLWQSGASDQAAHDELEVLLAECPLAGRVIHGYSDEPGFGQRLSADAWKRLSWVFGSDALRTIFLGLSAREVCLRLGFSEDWLDAKLLGPRPMQFQLCIFHLGWHSTCAGDALS